jgi:hypothetical protein
MKVKAMTIMDMPPTCRIVAMLRLAPRSIMANFRSFLDVNLTPGTNASSVLCMAFRAMPMNSAMTEALIIPCGSRDSRDLAAAAMTMASSRPGRHFFISYS